MFSSSGANFNRNLEKATSQLLLEPDWDSVLQIVDCIRQGDVIPKNALLAIKKKISHENPHVSMFALQVLEACVKNCGSSFHAEIATKEFMEYFKDQAKNRTDPVKEKVLELTQTWSHAFRNEPRYKAVEDTFHLMKMEGHKFPVLKESDAMFDAERAPSWKDGETCTRCRVQFTVVQRKHHCRNCGEVFCGRCSSKSSIIPKLGFEREVRVCDSCYEKINKAGASGKKDKEEDLPSEYLASPLSKQSQGPPSKSEQEQQEEEELMLALALSKSEHETKEKERGRTKARQSNYTKTTNDVAPTFTGTAEPLPLDTSDMDPELARYLNRHYWQQRSEQQQEEQPVSTSEPSAPTANVEPRNTMEQPTENSLQGMPHAYQNGETRDGQEQFLSALQGSLEILINRMKSNSQRGRPIANDSAVQSLFAVISEMHPQLMTQLQEREEARAYYEGLQDKLTQLRDAREALDSLRDEHREKRRREAEEAERLRQIQMMQKLEVMRQKKHEYLEMQRQLALQRLQEQEREMAARFEHQKQLTHMRQMQAFGYNQNYPAGGFVGHGNVPPPTGAVPAGYTSGAGSAEGSPQHRVAGAEGYGNMQQGMAHQGMSMPNMGPGQPAGYNMGQQQQMASMPPFVGNKPPGNFQPDMQGVMGQQQGYNDNGAVSLPPHMSMGGTVDSTQSGAYSLIQGQGTGGDVLQGQSQPMEGLPMDGQVGYMSTNPQLQDYQSFNMQDVSKALPPPPDKQPMYNSQMQQPQYPPSLQPQQQQQPQQPQQYQPYMGQYPQGQMPEETEQQPAQKEMQLISFD